MTQKNTEKKSDPGKTSRISSTASDITATSHAFLTRFFFKRKMDIDTLIDAAGEKRETEGVRLPEEISGLPEIEPEYEIGEVFAEGGHAEIFRAEDRNLQRKVAVKAIRPELMEDRKLRADFIREARLTSQLDHPAIVPIYGIKRRKTDNGLMMPMKIIDGMSLKDRLERTADQYERRGIRAFDERRSLRIRLDLFLKVCDAMTYAHSKGVIHCDLKPENIMIGKYHEAYVMDWGIARTREEQGDGIISGTPKYIAPETINGERPDERTDVFSLGMILFEIVTLAPAAKGLDSDTILKNTRQGIFNPVIHRFGYPIAQDLRKIIEKAMSLRREDRYRSVRKLADDVRNYIADLEVSANPQHLFARTCRWVGQHTALVVAGIFALLLLFASAIAFAGWQSYRQTELQGRRDRLLSLAYTTANMTAVQLDRLLLGVTQTAESLADTASYHLESQKSYSRVPVFFSVPGAKGVTPEPPGYSYAPFYGRKVSFEAFVCKTAPGVPESLACEMAARLDPLLCIFKGAMLKNRYASVLGKNGAEVEAALRERGGMIRLMYAGFENGVHLSYPCYGGYASEYDPRKRNWYQEAKDSSSLYIGNPYWDSRDKRMLIPCCAPIMDRKGTFLGVVGIDISLDELGTQMIAHGRLAGCVTDKSIVSQDGLVYVGRGTREQMIRQNGSAKLPSYQPRNAWQKIRRAYGHFFQKEQDREMLYIYSKLNTIPAYFIVRVDFDRMLQEYDLRQ